METVTGTAGNDTFNASLNVDNALGATSTLNSGDVVNGGAGVDKLNLTILPGAIAANTPIAELNSVEVVNVRDLGSGLVTLSAAAWTGVEQIWNDRSLVGGAVAVTDVQNNVTVGVNGVNAAGNSTAVTFDAAVFAAGGTAKLALNNAGREVNGVITDANVALDTNGAAGRVNALSIDATGANYLALANGAGGVLAGGAAGVQTLTVTGSGSVEIAAGSTLSAGSLTAELTTVNASANTGGLTIELANADVKVTGGSGNDQITLSNATALTNKAGISLGAGNDALLSNGSAGVGTSAVLDGGDGIDTISSLLVEVGNRANIKNFEVLDVTGDNRLIDASLFTASNFQSLAVSGAIGAGGVTVTKLAGTALNVDVSAAAVNDLTASLAGGATGTTDSLNVNFNANGAGAASLATITTTGTDSASIVSGGAAGDVNSITSITDTLNTLKTITITGANDFTLGGVTLNTAAVATTTAATSVAGALTLIDGSAATGDLNITAGASLTTGNLTMTYNALTIKTGSGDDVINIGGRGTVEAGAGADTINVAVAGVTVDVGVDEDVDTVVLALGARFTTNDGAFGPASRVTTISNMKQGDVIDLSALSNLNAITDFTATALTFGSLESAVNDARANGATDLLFFNWVDGNTYVVADSGNNDAVVKLVGTHADFAVAGGVITIA